MIKPYCIWLFGMPNSGKSTKARKKRSNFMKSDIKFEEPELGECYAVNTEEQDIKGCVDMVLFLSGQ